MLLQSMEARREDAGGAELQWAVHTPYFLSLASGDGTFSPFILQIVLERLPETQKRPVSFYCCDKHRD